MRQRTWFSGDLHQHSIYSSPAHGGTDNAPDTLEEIHAFMRAKDLRFGAVSDHHNILNHAAWLRFESPAFIPIVSKEISTGHGHVMALNTPVDVVFRYQAGDDGAVRREFVRICDEIHAAGGIAQLNHPRDRDRNISFPERFTDLIGIFDTMEVWNGSETMEPGTKNGDAFALWLRLLRSGTYLPATTGSDQHRIHEHMRERLIKTVVCAETFTRGHILQALTRGHSFLTSGPFLNIEVNGASYGETAVIDDTLAYDGIAALAGSVQLQIELRADEAVDTLYVYDDRKGEPAEIPIHAASFHDTVLYDAGDAAWLVFVAGSSTWNKAITNPVFLKRQS